MTKEERRVQIIQKRLKERRCIDCGAGNIPENRDTGFWEHRCKPDKEAHENALLEAARKQAGESVHARAKRLKREGIKNLDRLLGVES